METIVEDVIQEAGPGEVRAQSSYRLVALLAALALVVAGVAIVRGSLSPAPTRVVSQVDHKVPGLDGAGAVLGKTLGFGAVPAQIGPNPVSAIVCPILTALAAGPFGVFIAPVIAALRIAFGCASQ